MSMLNIYAPSIHAFSKATAGNMEQEIAALASAWTQNSVNPALPTVPLLDGSVRQSWEREAKLGTRAKALRNVEGAMQHCEVKGTGDRRRRQQRSHDGSEPHLQPQTP